MGVDEIELVNVADLKPFMKNVCIVFKVSSLGDTQEFISKKDGMRHRLREVVVGDASGAIVLTVWDDTIDEIEQNMVYLNR